ncbi:hypothetical protein Tco_0323275 [Tanacetum coccineum]
MLAPKGSTFNGRPTFANSMYLKKAQSEKPCLYEVPYDTYDLANRFAPDREETLTLEQESILKFNKDLGLEVGSIRRIQRIGYGVLEFLGVGTTFDMFQNIHILYLQYAVLTSFGYGVLIFFALWSLVSAGTDTSYLP